MFITFEGIDGAGKSTQTKILSEKLKLFGFKTTTTCEPTVKQPGVVSISELIFKGVNEANHCASERWFPVTEALLFMADRYEHVENVIRPALKNGFIVLCDRYIDSTIAYQGIGYKALSPEELMTVHNICVGLMPDITILLDIDPVDAYKRREKRKQHENMDNDGKQCIFERSRIEDMTKRREIFLHMANHNNNRYVIVQADEPEKHIADEIWSNLQRIYPEFFCQTGNNVQSV